MGEAGDGKKNPDNFHIDWRSFVFCCLLLLAIFTFLLPLVNDADAALLALSLMLSLCGMDGGRYGSCWGCVCVLVCVCVCRLQVLSHCDGKLFVQFVSEVRRALSIDPNAANVQQVLPLPWP